MSGACLLPSLAWGWGPCSFRVHSLTFGLFPCLLGSPALAFVIQLVLCCLFPALGYPPSFQGFPWSCVWAWRLGPVLATPSSQETLFSAVLLLPCSRGPLPLRLASLCSFIEGAAPRTPVLDRQGSRLSKFVANFFLLFADTPSLPMRKRGDKRSRENGRRGI